MENRTVYTHELLLKMKMHYLAKSKKTTWIMLFFTGGLSIYAIVTDLVFEHAHTLYVGMFFLAYALLFGLVAIQNGKSKLSKAVEKELAANPDTVMEFWFEQDCLKTKQTSRYATGNACHSYEFFDKAVKMDENSFYLLTKQNQFYVLYDQNDISELYDFVCEKIKNSRT